MADIFPESREEEILVSMIDGEEYNKAPESRIEALLLELKEVIEEGGGGGGTTNYNLLQNKPSINSVTLTGDKTSSDLGIPTAADLAGKQDVLPVTASGNDVAFNGDIQDGQGNTLSVLAEALTKTASGNPVVISDCAGGKARSLITSINAIQDLHGYDKPWAGGADINYLDLKARFPDTAKSVTSDGITYTRVDDTDGNPLGVQASNTATGYSYCDVQLNLEAGRYKSAVTGIEANKMSLNLRKGTNRDYFKAANEEFTLTEQTLIWVRFTVNQGDSANNTIKCMIYKYDGTDKAFRPYSNICPISGRTEARVDTENEDSTESAYATIQLGTTVYGADINWDTGVATVKFQLVTGAWTKHPNYTHIFYRSGIGEKTFPATELSTAKSNVLPTVKTTTIADLEALGYGLRITDVIYVACEVASTAEEFSTWATANGLQVCYELATPITIQLTPTQLQMLKGYNRVTIESGSIEIEYIAKAISGNDEEIAPLVGDKATKAYAVNDFIERADGLYRVTAPIASGASFTANNTVKMSIGEALTYLYNK